VSRRAAQPENKLDQNDLINKLRVFFYALRQGQKEKVLATLVVALYVAAAYLRQEWKEFPQAAYLAYVLCVAFALWLIYRVWKQATPPPPPAAGPVPSAIKGLLPFTAADGLLFAQLGRHIELQQLLALAQNEQIAISAVRGESGAGKTSLLRAGLSYTLGEQQCVYWEAVPENAPLALLHAIRSQFPEIESLESLPGAFSKRCVLILDQFEQLRIGEPAHASIFALLGRIANAAAPHKLSTIVSFRREYAADWLDLERAFGFRADQVPLNLLAPRTAGDALIALAGEAGFTLDQALVNNFISGVASPQGVSPVDVSIGLLSLANFVQQSGAAHVGRKEYDLAGGAEGLLQSFVQQKLEEIPEAMRAPLLKGIVLALVNPSNNQRIAAGEPFAVIAAKAGVSAGALASCLDRLAHPRIRLLEQVGQSRYRLPHERLVPVLRRLAGITLASLDQLRLLFEGEYARWWETRSSRHLLRGKNLQNVLRHRSQLIQGATIAEKTAYLAACLRRRTLFRLALSVTGVAAAIGTFAGYRLWDASVQQSKLASWHLPSELFKTQAVLDEMNINSHSVNDLGWLRSTRLKKLDIAFDGSQISSLNRLTALSSLSLDLSARPKGIPNSPHPSDWRSSQVTSLTGLGQIEGLTSLSLALRESQVTSLAGLEEIKGLTSLSLDLSESQVTSLAALEQIKKLTSLSVWLDNPQMKTLAGLQHLKGLTSLSLNLVGSNITSLAELGQLKGLASLSLDLSRSQVTSLAGLEQLKELTSLSLTLDSSTRSLNGLEQLTGLTSLSLDLSYSDITSLAGLERLKGLTSLSLTLDPSITSLTELEQLTGLTSLSLGLSIAKVKNLAELEQLKAITSLSLDLGSTIMSLAELGQLKGLSSLSLNVGSDLTSLAGLEQLRSINTLSLNLGSGVESLAGLEQFKGLTTLLLDLGGSHITSLVGLEQLKALKTLSLNLNPEITNLAGLEQLNALTSLSLNLPSLNLLGLEDVIGMEQLKGLEQLTTLTSLSLNLGGTHIKSLAGLEQLKALTSLSLDLTDTQITSVAAVEQLKALTSIKITLPASLAASFGSLRTRPGIIEIWIVIDDSTSPNASLLNVPTGCKFAGLKDR
jgi:hypothetical protein